MKNHFTASSKRRGKKKQSFGNTALDCSRHVTRSHELCLSQLQRCSLIIIYTWTNTPKKKRTSQWLIYGKAREEERCRIMIQSIAMNLASLVDEWPCNDCGMTMRRKYPKYFNIKKSFPHFFFDRGHPVVLIRKLQIYIQGVSRR